MLRTSAVPAARRPLAAAWLLPTALLLAALLAPRAHAAERYTLSGDRVALYDLAGEVTLEPAASGPVAAEVTRGGGDAAKLRIETSSVNGRSALRIVFPSDHVVYPKLGFSNTNIRVRSDGTFGGDDKTLWLLGRSVRISGMGGGLAAHADVRLLVPRGADVLVRLACGDVHVTNVDSKLFLDLAHGDVETSGTRGTLGVDTGSGTVHVGNATGPVSIDTGSGSVTVRGMRGEALSIDTGSGGVDVSDVDVPALSIDTGSGHVDMDGVNARTVHVDTGSGGVSVALVAALDELNIDTGSGTVEVMWPRDAGATLNLEAGSGGIDVDLPITNLRRDHGELRGRVGDGRGAVVIETGSGGIHIGSRQRD